MRPLGSQYLQQLISIVVQYALRSLWIRVAVPSYSGEIQHSVLWSSRVPIDRTENIYSYVHGCYGVCIQDGGGTLTGFHCSKQTIEHDNMHDCLLSEL